MKSFDIRLFIYLIIPYLDIITIVTILTRLNNSYKKLFSNCCIKQFHEYKTQKDELIILNNIIVELDKIKNEFLYRSYSVYDKVIYQKFLHFIPIIQERNTFINIDYELKYHHNNQIYQFLKNIIFDNINKSKKEIKITKALLQNTKINSLCNLIDKLKIFNKEEMLELNLYYTTKPKRNWINVFLSSQKLKGLNLINPQIKQYRKLNFN